MPRQPLSFVSGTKQFHLGPNALRERPEHAAIIAQCIECWSYVELNMALCLGEIIGASSEAAVAVFLSLRNARAQRDAVCAAAEAALAAQELDVTEAVLSIYASIGKRRHDLAHGLYGYSPDIEDALLWAETSKHSKYHIQQSLKLLAGKESHTEKDKDEMRNYIYVYKKQDLIEVLDLIRQAHEITSFSVVYFKYRRNPISFQLFRQLCGLPLVAKELFRIQQGKKSIPETPSE